MLLSRRTIALFALLTLAACNRDKGKTEEPIPAQPTDADDPRSSKTKALWQLAPSDLQLGLVVADGVVASLQDGMLTLNDALANAPGDGAEVAAALREVLVVGEISLLDPEAPGSYGIDLARGMAYFQTERGRVGIWPVGDRTTFVKAMGGKSEGEIDTLGDDMFCKELSGRYACAESRELLDSLSTGGTTEHNRPAPYRGEIEFFASPDGAASKLQIPVTAPIRAVMQIESGAFTVRASLPSPVVAAVVKEPIERSKMSETIDASKVSGLALLQLSSLYQVYKDELLARMPDEEIVAGVSVLTLMRSLTGDVVAHTANGSPPRGQVLIGLEDVEPARALVKHCKLPMPMPGLVLERRGDACAVEINEMLTQSSTTVRFAAAVRDGALVLDFGDTSAASENVPPSKLTREFLEQPYAFAVWGRGIVGESWAEQLVSTNSMGAEAGMIQLITWGIFHVSELGYGFHVQPDGAEFVLRFRTTFANPEAVRAKLEPLLVRLARGDAAAIAAIRKLADSHPDSPLAKDLAAGEGGLMVGTAVQGMVAALAIPAYMKYIKKSKAVEAPAFITRMGTGAQDYYAEHGTLPKSSGGPTPALGSSCSGPDGERCLPNSSLWSGESWTSLKFSVDDPHYYSYEFKAAEDGKSFEAIAYGDLDCDGEYSTFRLHGTAAGGKKSIIEPEHELE